MEQVYFKHPFTTTKEFLTKQIFSSEILVSFSDREFRDFSNGTAALLEHLQEGPLAPGDASVDKEARELSPAVGASLPAVIQSSLLNLSANSYKNLSPPPFFLPPSASRSWPLGAAAQAQVAAAQPPNPLLTPGSIARSGASHVAEV